MKNMLITFLALGSLLAVGCAGDPVSQLSGNNKESYTRWTDLGWMHSYSFREVGERKSKIMVEVLKDNVGERKRYPETSWGYSHSEENNEGTVYVFETGDGRTVKLGNFNGKRGIMVEGSPMESSDGFFEQ